MQKRKCQRAATKAKKPHRLGLDATGFRESGGFSRGSTNLWNHKTRGHSLFKGTPTQNLREYQHFKCPIHIWQTLWRSSEVHRGFPVRFKQSWFFGTASEEDRDAPYLGWWQSDQTNGKQRSKMYQIWICSSLLVTSNAANGAPKEYAQGQTQHGKKNWFILEPSKTKTLSTSGKSEEPSQLPLLSQCIISHASSPCPNSSLARAPSPDPWSKGKNPTLGIWSSRHHKEARLAAGFSVSDPGETFWWPGTKY